MLSATQRREVWNVEFVQGLTWINRHCLAGQRDSSSAVLGLGLLSQLHLLMILKPSPRHSNMLAMHPLGRASVRFFTSAFQLLTSQLAELEKLRKRVLVAEPAMRVKIQAAAPRH